MKTQAYDVATYLCEVAYISDVLHVTSLYSIVRSLWYGVAISSCKKVMSLYKVVKSLYVHVVVIYFNGVLIYKFKFRVV